MKLEGFGLWKKDRIVEFGFPGKVHTHRDWANEILGFGSPLSKFDRLLAGEWIDGEVDISKLEEFYENL